jgi:DNA-binding GntR family transcriptional regulator
MDELRAAIDGYERAVRSRDWAQAVNCDLEFHSLLIHMRRNQRLETLYQKVIGELRMGMVLVDRSHNDPGTLVPLHRKLYQLLSAGKLKQCADLLLQHLDDSEARLGGIMAGEIGEAWRAQKNRRNSRGREASRARAS